MVANGVCFYREKNRRRSVRVRDKFQCIRKPLLRIQNNGSNATSCRPEIGPLTTK